MKILRSLLVMFGVVACAPAGEVKVFPKPDVDFSQYKTYEWVAPRVLTKQGVLENDPDFAPLIKKAVNAELESKGLKMVPSGGQLRIQAAGIGGGTPQVDALIFTGFDYYYGYGATTMTAITRFNKEGTLAVSLIDVPTGKPVWSGFATEGLAARGDVEATIKKAASRLFKKYPPKSKK